MDPLSQLPLECLHIILEFLAQDNHTPSLASLLQTNRHFANVILPYLYRDPYQFTSYEKPDPQPSHDTRANDPIIAQLPTRTLLNSLPPSTVLPKVLSLGMQRVNPFVTDSADFLSKHTYAASKRAGPPSPLNYLAQIRHLHQQSCAIGADQLWKWTQPPPGVASYIQTQEFLDLCEASCLFPSNWSYFAGSKQEFSQGCFQILFFREASWALAEPILEQLQALTIPTSILARYLDPSSVGRRLRKLERNLESSPICRLRRLERVHFLLDRVAASIFLIERDKETVRKEEEMEFGSMVRFVQEHIRYFPGVLKSVTTSQSSFPTFRWREYSCPENIQLELNRMLPAMVKPTSLDTQDLLLRFLAYPLATDLNRVTELDLTVLKECDVRGILNETGDILQRCCALRKLTIDNAREDTFKLAMNEQKLYNQLNHKTGLSRSHQDAHAITEWEGYVSSQSELQHKGLVPLEEFNIYNWSLPSTEVMDDVVTTFSKTLKRLCAIEYSVVGDSAALSTYCHIGGNWVDLRLLTLLSLTTSSRRIVIDRHLLTRCPNLVNIYILDYTEQYNLRDVKTCIPARLRSLESLQLTGWSALTFHSETLHSTNRLKDLSITILGFDSGDHVYSWDGVDDFIFCDHYIPPIEDLYRSYDLQNDSSTITLSLTPAHIRPKWTWDWHLPQLVLLELSSEFAFLFQFRMLQGCPALQSLELEIRTPTSSHRRTITSIDMFTPNPSCDPIIVPYLIKLRMHGPWRFTDPSMVSSFLTGMFPSLESFSALGLDGLPLSDLIQWIRGAPKPPIKELFLDTSYFCDTEDMKKLKLVGKKDRGEYGEKDILTTVTIFNEQFFLLR